MSSAAKEFEEFARDCVRLAERADTPELREKLLNLAREWMHAVMDDEDAESAAQRRRPMASALRRDRRRRLAPLARRRTVTKRRPYEPRIVGGKVVIMPADLQRLHQRLLNSAVIEVISDEIREVVETEWPELSHKLPPKPGGLHR